MQIVLARLDETVAVVKPGRTDLGERSTFKKVYVPVACMWLNRGTDADVERAKEFAAREGYTVLCFVESETDPLARAKKEIARHVA